MNKEDKQLLFIDLCARLPYHVRCKVWLKDATTEEGPLDLQHNYSNVLQDAFYYNEIKNIKPYLRSMSSMTEEEKEEYYCLCYDEQVEVFEYGEWGTKIYFHDTIESIDWLNANHFDYRGLIEKGLAIEVNEDNNPYGN